MGCRLETKSRITTGCCILFSLHHPLLLKGEGIKTEIQDEDEPDNITNIKIEVFKNCRTLR